MPPSKQQAIEFTAVVAGAAVLSVATGGFGAPVGAMMIESAFTGAAVSDTVYDVENGANANLEGAVGAAASGAISGAAGGAGVYVGPFAGAMLSAAGSAAGDITNSYLTTTLNGGSWSVSSVDWRHVFTDAAISGITYHLGDYLAGESGFSNQGARAIRSETLRTGFWDASIHPKAAFEVYSMLFGAGAGGLIDYGVNRAYRYGGW